MAERGAPSQPERPRLRLKKTKYICADQQEWLDHPSTWPLEDARRLAGLGISTKDGTQFMLFNSFEFLFLFLPLALLAFYVSASISQTAALASLALASLVFYGWWSPGYTILLLLSILFNYGCGALITGAQNPRMAYILLCMAVAANLLLLAFYKYIDLAIGALNGLFGLSFPLQHILLPIGISFFTFTQIAFLVDVYKRLAKEYNPLHYLLFVTYFPHLIAGPVLHHKQMMPQFGSPRIFQPQADNFAVGTAFLVIGLCKKVLIADSFAPYASGLFDGAATPGAAPHLLLAWTGVLSYTMQIYFDFSGYSDMAIGLSRLFGVKLPLNFASPYKATSIIEFWRRWHMSLSQFLRDYLYIPLGGNRKGRVRRYANLLATMLLGGLWHGANWTFLVWGGLHGFYLIVNHAWTAWRERIPGLSGRSSRLAAATSWSLTFIAVMVAWVFFRSPDFTAAGTVLKGMIGLNGVWAPYALKDLLGPAADFAATQGVVFATPVLTFSPGGSQIGSTGEFFGLAALGFALLACPNSQQLLARYGPAMEEVASPFPRLRLGRLAGVAMAALLFLCLAGLNHKSEFLYFQF